MIFNNDKEIGIPNFTIVSITKLLFTKNLTNEQRITEFQKQLNASDLNFYTVLDKKLINEKLSKKSFVVIDLEKIVNEFNIDLSNEDNVNTNRFNDMIICLNGMYYYRERCFNNKFTNITFYYEFIDNVLYMGLFNLDTNKVISRLKIVDYVKDSIVYKPDISVIYKSEYIYNKFKELFE